MDYACLCPCGCQLLRLSMQHGTRDNLALDDLKRCKVDHISTSSGTAVVTIKCITSMQIYLSVAPRYISIFCVLFISSLTISKWASATLEWGQGCICEPMFLSKSHSVNPLWYPLGLFSLIPFHTAWMVFPANNVAEIMCANKRSNPKPVIEPSDPVCYCFLLKAVVSALHCVHTNCSMQTGCPWGCHFYAK